MDIPHEIKKFFTAKVVLSIVGLLVLLGLVLYVAFYVDSCRFKSGIEKKQENVNAKLSNIANREQTIANLDIQQAVEKEQLREATEELLDAKGATDEARVETNRALANLQNAKTTKATNTSVADLEEKLKGL